jgi:hypothetical protein
MGKVRHALFLLLLPTVSSFIINQIKSPQNVSPLFCKADESDGRDEADDTASRDERLQQELVTRMENLSTIDELTYKVEAARLERRNLRARLKAKPKFLPLAECKKWVQAWGRRWESEQEWREWIDMGEKVRNNIKCSNSPPSCHNILTVSPRSSPSAMRIFPLILRSTTLAWVCGMAGTIFSSILHRDILSILCRDILRRDKMVMRSRASFYCGQNLPSSY